jgi:hypothetical protein
MDNLGAKDKERRKKQLTEHIFVFLKIFLNNKKNAHKKN